MTSRASRILLLAVGLWATAALPVSASTETVILLSWDGMRFDYADRGHFPGLERMAKGGIRAGRLTPVYPSSTFPGHVSLATGTYPDRHGIVNNDFFDRSRSRNGGVYRMSSDADWIEAEPLWIASERQGIRAATYFWVGSQTDWRGQGASYRMAPFDSERPEAAKVDQILAWLKMPDAERPRLIMSHWAGADDVGHVYGPNSDQLVEQIASQDMQLQRLLVGIHGTAGWDDTTLIIVSDHGMAEATEYIDLHAALADAGIVARVSGGTVAQIFVDDADNDPELIARAGTVLKRIPDVEVYPRSGLPAWMRLSHPTRTGDWVVTTGPPNSFARPEGLVGKLMSLMSAVGWRFGSHGYRPERVSMGGVFFALGRGVPSNLHLPVVHQVDVAATVARLLGIDPPLHSEGRPIPGIGGLTR